MLKTIQAFIYAMFTFLRGMFASKNIADIMFDFVQSSEDCAFMVGVPVNDDDYLHTFTLLEDDKGELFIYERFFSSSSSFLSEFYQWNKEAKNFEPMNGDEEERLRELDENDVFIWGEEESLATISHDNEHGLQKDRK